MTLDSESKHVQRRWRKYRRFNSFANECRPRWKIHRIRSHFFAPRVQRHEVSRKVSLKRVLWWEKDVEVELEISPAVEESDISDTYSSASYTGPTAVNLTLELILSSFCGPEHDSSTTIFSTCSSPPSSQLCMCKTILISFYDWYGIQASSPLVLEVVTYHYTAAAAALALRCPSRLLPLSVLALSFVTLNYWAVSSVSATVRSS